MEVWLDTCDINVVTEANRFGFIYGITTNPTILASANEDPETVLNQLLAIQDGPITVQITADNSDEMIKRALGLRVFSDRIIIKIPVTQQGLVAIKNIRQEDIPVMATAVFSPTQALLAALAGANYVASYFGRMIDGGIDAQATVQSILTIFRKHSFDTKLLVASLKTVDQISSCAEMGVDAITVKKTLFNEWVSDNDYTLDSLKTFAADWKARDQPKTSALIL